MLRPFAVAILTAATLSGSGQAPSSLIGRWDLSITGPTSSFPGWLEVRRERTGLTGRLQWGWGHATPLTDIKAAATGFSFTWPNADDPKASSHATGKVTGAGGGVLAATLIGGDGNRYAVAGVPAPVLTRQPRDTAAWGAPIDLLSGGLAGWTARGAQNGWTLSDGVLSNAMPSSDLISKLLFRDFKLHIEVNVPRGGNSGIYLRGRHEIQIMDSYGNPPGNREMGGVYGQVAPSRNASRPAGEWQSFDITWVGRRVKVVLNGMMIADFAEVPGITGGALNADEAGSGPLMLQGDHTEMQYRNIQLRPAIPADTPELRGLRRSELARFELMAKGDTMTLRRFLADELAYTHSNGLVESKAVHLAGIGSGHIGYQSLVPAEFSYRAYGSTVVGTGSVKSIGLFGGTPFDVALRVSTVHVWRDGRWQLVIWQSTRLP